MKKLLYTGIALLLAILIYFIGCTDWLKGKTQQGDDVVFTPSTRDKPIPGQYILQVPKDPKSKEYVAFEKFIGKHFLKIENKAKCPCNEDLQMWTAKVDFEPDTDPPTVPPDTMMRSGFLSRNYSVTLDKSIGLKYDFKLEPEKGNLVKIAILDTGVDTSITTLGDFLHRNPNLSFLCDSRIAEGKFGMNMLFLTGEQTGIEPQDNDGHGTFINGVIAGLASYPPSYRKYERARKVSLDVLNVKIGENTKTGTTLFKALCGMHYAVKKKSDILNLSWRISPQKVDINSIAQAFVPVLREIEASKTMVVASSGNNGEEDLLHLPSAFSRPFPIRVGSINSVIDFSNSVVSVGAWNTANNQIADFSNEGRNVDIYAPGQNIRSLALGGGSSRGSGTSFSAPYVTQRLAELIGEDPSKLNLKATLISRHSTLINTYQVLIMR